MKNTHKLQITCDQGNPIWQQILFNFIGLFYLWSISVLSLCFDNFYILGTRVCVCCFLFAIFPFELNLRTIKTEQNSRSMKFFLGNWQQTERKEKLKRTRNGILGIFVWIIAIHLNCFIAVLAFELLQSLFVRNSMRSYKNVKKRQKKKHEQKWNWTIFQVENLARVKRLYLDTQYNACMDGLKCERRK